MNILLIGSGGREHALAWKILQSPRLSQLYVTSAMISDYYNSSSDPSPTCGGLPSDSPPTCGGRSGGGEIVPITIPEQDIAPLVTFTQQKKIDIVVIGGETPLAAGLSDALREANIRVFGPSRIAAEIETSKAFAKDFMARHAIPTANYKTFTDFATALQHIQTIHYPYVIKASGLAGGKGVFLPETLQEGELVLKQILQDKTLGNAGSEVIIEERLQGEEVSLLAFSDGVHIKVMPTARDHKRLLEGDKGPNTGGMGVFAPVTLPTNISVDALAQTILQPTIDGLRAEARPFIGVLYAGIMLTPQGPRVLEFNCRFGDPETQVLLPLLRTDLITIMESCIAQSLNQCDIAWHAKAAACVVLASEGYPQKNQIGREITGLQTEIENTIVFHAGTQLQNGKTITTGGRVLGVTGLGNSLTAALNAAYRRVETIHFEGMQLRKDIGSNTTVDHYAAAGVDISAGNKTVTLMTQAVRSTYGPEVLAGIGAFGGMFSATALKNMHEPVLVASTDGIGTKVHLAAQAQRLNSLGYDIVNHSVNDILVQGAKPLFFLDYLAASRIDPEKMALIVTGMAEACKAAGCALLGGETAEMPGVYMPDTFDVAGTIVGVVERANALPQSNLQAGDVLLGIASSGPHTNGYSLIRKIFADVALDTVFPELGIPLADALLAPHRSYLPVLNTALQHSDKPIKALVHITGGGFLENIPRILPNNLNAQIHCKNWPLPALFKLMQQRGQVPFEQMCRVFNMGIGMIVIAAPEQVATLRALIKEEIWQIGELVAGEKHVVVSES